MAQYDDVAARYEALVAPQYQRIAQAVADRAPGLADRDVFEVGAGTGLLTRLLAPRARWRSYIASDVSPRMLEVARTLVDAEVEYMEADVRKLPVEDSKFDLVIGSLTPLQDVETGFSEARRVLRTGGDLVIGFWGDVYAELELLDEVRRRLDLGAYERNRESAALARASAAGFARATLDVVRLPVHHASVDAYVAYRASFGRLAFVPEDRQGDWEAALREVSEAWKGPDGCVDLDWIVAILHAAKD